MTGLAVALAMPPRVSNVDWSNFLDLEKSYPQMSQRLPFESKRWSEEPLLHGGFRIDPGDRWVELLSLDGSTIQNIRLVEGGRKIVDRKVNSVSRAEELFFDKEPSFSWRHPKGRFEIHDQRELVYYSNAKRGDVWRHRLADQVSGYAARNVSRDVIAWTQSPPLLYFLVWGKGSLWQKSVIHTYKWDASSEPVDAFFCDRRHVVLVENLKNGLLRLLLFRAEGLEGLIPLHYSLRSFDGDAGAKVSHEISGVRHRGCKDIFMAGSFGLVEDSYVWGN